MILLRRQTVPIMESQVACSRDVVDEVVVNRSASIRIFFRETYNVRTWKKSTIAHLKDSSFILLTVDSQQSFWCQEYIYSYCTHILLLVSQVSYICMHVRTYYRHVDEYPYTYIYTHYYIYTHIMIIYTCVYIYNHIYMYICYYVMPHNGLIYNTLFNSVYIYT